ncbi:hypothetical protein GCM10007079_22250 [Nocardiopsis terrae]|uniref:Uncharacterized protein n=1 Tax=Nocardiopsis terrae TaxID=372655 RepID=A0ABR9HGL5_9ACTN|nr:hypothetical protein [Nocardiopsis terrae]MBE1458163.1 hypothetical protein [Nocardiopsis terrae]GHC81840.1 hypothetical protein GCM10007079_22250 [Nocardiopsis terrae]
MTNPIPEPRSAARVSLREPAQSGPACDTCAHRTCRLLRARHLPLLGGHRREFAREHLRAAALQARNPHRLIWFGESTQSYWVADARGLTEAADSGSLLVLLDPCPER